MNLSKASIIVLLFGQVHFAAGQNIASANLHWTSDQTTNLRSQETTQYVSSFITRGTSSVNWIQKNGQVNTSYSVTGTDGSWTDIETNGSFIYYLSRDGKGGRLTVERDAGGFFITLDFSESGQHSIKQKFRVTSVSLE